MSEQLVCRACRAPIRFVPTPGGKAMPLNPAPVPSGNVAIRHGVAVVLSGEELVLARAAGEELYRSHFVDCPASARFRKGR